VGRFPDQYIRRSDHFDAVSRVCTARILKGTGGAQAMDGVTIQGVLPCPGHQYTLPFIFCPVRFWDWVSFYPGTECFFCICFLPGYLLLPEMEEPDRRFPELNITDR
jgi:hypothetical protein